MSVGEVLAGAARWHVERAEALAFLRTLPDASVDAVVTDPPYELGFMGKAWDASGVAYRVDLWREVLRVLKPGGHLLAFGGTRTYHRMTCAIEDAGAEIRDSIHWLFGSGFPKSVRVNRDPTFCQCDEPAHSGACTTREPSKGDHTGTADPSRDDAHCCEGGHRSTRGEPGSRACCLPGCDSRGGRLRQAQAGALASAPSRGCAPKRSRSVEPSDGSACEQARSPSQARCSDRPSSPGCVRLSNRERHEEPRGTVPSTLPKRGIGTGSGSRENRTRNTVESLSASHQRNHGLLICEACGKPISNGWGTALKPAHEPCVLARKPLAGTVAANVAEHGTGAINVDACRIGTSKRTPGFREAEGDESRAVYGRGLANVNPTDGLGRWPSNVVLSHLPECREVGVRRVRRELRDATAHVIEGDGRFGTMAGSRSLGAVDEDVPAYDCAPGCPVAALDEQSAARGMHSAGKAAPAREEWGGSNGYHGNIGTAGGARVGDVEHGNAASRFYYVAKASQAERHAGLPPRGNRHTTVKPLALMRWLARLVTPPGGVVLDPFTGSGSTGCACALEGFRFVGIEREPEYVEIARARIAHWEAQATAPAKPKRAPKLRPVPAPPPSAPRPADDRQIDLFDRRTA